MTLAEMARHIAQRDGLDVEAIRGFTLEPALVQARVELVRYGRVRGLTYTQIGRFLDRSHWAARDLHNKTTVLKRMMDRMGVPAMLRAMSAELESGLTGDITTDRPIYRISGRLTRAAEDVEALQ
jgi:hypothetical protein